MVKKAAVSSADLYFKRLGHQMNIFLSPTNLKQNTHILYMRKWFVNFLACLVQENNKYKASACFFENTCKFRRL
jgi:hypothetical protein